MSTSITPTEIGISFGAYVAWMFLVLSFAMTSLQGSKIFGIFTKSLLRIVAALVILVTIGSLALFYLNFVAAIIVGLLFLTAVVGIVTCVSSGRMSWDNAATALLLLLFLGVPLAFTMWQRDDMTDTARTLAWSGTGLFWLFSLLAIAFKTNFFKEFAPFGKTVTLLLLLVVTMFVLLYSAGEWAVALVLLLAFFTFLVLAMNRNNRLLSLSLSTFRDSPGASAFIVGTAIFCAALSMTLSMTKDQQHNGQNTFVLTTLLTVVVVLWVLGVIVSEAIMRMNSRQVSLKDKARRGDVKVSQDNLDVFASRAQKHKKRSRREN